MCLFITLLSVAGLAIGSCTLMTPDCVYFAEPNLIFMGPRRICLFTLYLCILDCPPLSFFQERNDKYE